MAKFSWRVGGIILAVFASLFFFNPSLAQDTEAIDTGTQTFKGYARGDVISVDTSDQQEVFGQKIVRQELKVKLLTGDEKDKEVTVNFTDFSGTGKNSYKTGEGIVLAMVQNGPDLVYEAVDHYRLPAVWVIIFIFVLVVLIVARGRGFTSLVSLAVSIIVIIKFLVPQLLSGTDPVLATLMATAIIAVVSFFVGHGISKRSSLGLFSTLLSLGVGLGLAYGFVYSLRLFGVASEETMFVQNFAQGAIDLRGLLLAGIVIGMLGVLDDVTATQTAAADELKKSAPESSFKELFAGTFRIGKEHVVGLVNTMFLVYAGTVLPLFLLFAVNSNQPAWVLLNSEFVTEEIARALAGGTALILAVPISTAIAAWFYSRKPKATDQEVVEKIIVVEAEVSENKSI